MSLYMRSRNDKPHLQHPFKPAQTICGLPMVGAREVTKLQVQVFLGGSRCESCVHGISEARS